MNVMEKQSQEEKPEVARHDNNTALEGLRLLAREVKTATLSTVSREGVPEASYSPCLVDDDGNIWIYISALARHTVNLKRHPRASVMLIEDEGTAASLYGRRRVTWQCDAALVDRDTAPFEEKMDRFRERFGEISDHLAGMQDFSLFRLKPEKGRLVLGFGAAFSLKGWHIEGQVHGRHRPKKS